MNEKTSDDRAQRAIPAMTGAVNLLNKLLGSDDIKTSHKARLRTVLAEITAMQQRACEPATAQQAVVVDADAFHAMNGELCDFAIRWQLDGDYLRCTGCKRPQLTNYAGEAFVHAGGCKQADTSEVHPWLALRRIMRPIFAPVAAAPVECREQAIKMARESAVMHRFQHGYLPQSRDEANDWQPHEWVVAAIQAAALPSTPAAPGIDLPGWAFERPSGADVIVISAPNGMTWIAEQDDLLHMLAAAVIDASPKGGSDAQMVPYQRALDLIGDAYNAGTHGIGYSQQAMELYDALQATSAEGMR